MTEPKLCVFHPFLSRIGKDTCLGSSCLMPGGDAWHEGNYLGQRGAGGRSCCRAPWRRGSAGWGWQRRPGVRRRPGRPGRRWWGRTGGPGCRCSRPAAPVPCHPCRACTSRSCPCPPAWPASPRSGTHPAPWQWGESMAQAWGLAVKAPPPMEELPPRPNKMGRWRKPPQKSPKPLSHGAGWVKA